MLEIAGSRLDNGDRWLIIAESPLMKTRLLFLAGLLFSTLLPLANAAEPWSIQTESDWSTLIESADGVVIEGGTASPEAKSGTLRTKLHKLAEKQSLESLTVQQSALWQNWTPVDRVGPKNLQDAPVFLTKGPHDYWMFGRYGKAGGKKKGNEAPFTAEDATLEGFDIPLKTTPFANQYDAPGGLKPGLGGYHAWQSKDMVNWVHHGPVTEGFSRWVTTAEQVDGKTYIYYDFPNDQDPHLYIDEDLTDGLPGENKGLALEDPSDGSDCAVIRDPEGYFHIIYEDWSPINARQHSWDSPLAGHAVSEDGIDGFKLLDPVVDERTKPTGEFAEYLHPHWTKEDPENFPTSIARYEIHEPEQDAYGDWAAILVGSQYYLFCDFHPAHQPIKIAWFTSSSLDKQFEFCGEIGKGHPDPDIGFAEGQFYLMTQTPKDYVSPGPWVETVTARVGVDTDNDAKVDQWSDWAEVKEGYDYKPGFSKHVQRTPAQLDLSALPEGYGFQIELKLEDSTENDSKPLIESLQLHFK